MIECTINHVLFRLAHSSLESIFYTTCTSIWETDTKTSVKIETNAEKIRTPTSLFYRWFLFARPFVTSKFDSGKKKENQVNLSKKSESEQFVAASDDFPPTRKKKYLKDTWNWPTKTMLWKCPMASWYFPDIELWSQSQSEKGEQLNLSTLAIAEIKATRTKT